MVFSQILQTAEARLPHLRDDARVSPFCKCHEETTGASESRVYVGWRDLIFSGHCPAQQRLSEAFPGFAEEDIRVRFYAAHHRQTSSKSPLVQRAGSVRRRNRGGQDPDGKRTARASERAQHPRRLVSQRSSRHCSFPVCLPVALFPRDEPREAQRGGRVINGDMDSASPPGYEHGNRERKVEAAWVPGKLNVAASHDKQNAPSRRYSKPASATDLGRAAAWTNPYRAKVGEILSRAGASNRVRCNGYPSLPTKNDVLQRPCGYISN